MILTFSIIMSVIKAHSAPETQPLPPVTPAEPHAFFRWAGDELSGTFRPLPTCLPFHLPQAPGTFTCGHLVLLGFLFLLCL